MTSENPPVIVAGIKARWITFRMWFQLLKLALREYRSVKKAWKALSSMLILRKKLSNVFITGCKTDKSLSFLRIHSTAVSIHKELIILNRGSPLFQAQEQILVKRSDPFPVVIVFNAGGHFLPITLNFVTVHN